MSTRLREVQKWLQNTKVLWQSSVLWQLSVLWQFFVWQLSVLWQSFTNHENDNRQFRWRGWQNWKSCDWRWTFEIENSKNHMNTKAWYSQKKKFAQMYSLFWILFKAQTRTWIYVQRWWNISCCFFSTHYCKVMDLETQTQVMNNQLKRWGMFSRIHFVFHQLITKIH